MYELYTNILPTTYVLYTVRLDIKSFDKQL